MSEKKSIASQEVYDAYETIFATVGEREFQQLSALMEQIISFSPEKVRELETQVKELRQQLNHAHRERELREERMKNFVLMQKLNEANDKLASKDSRQKQLAPKMCILCKEGRRQKKWCISESVWFRHYYFMKQAWKQRHRVQSRDRRHFRKEKQALQDICRDWE
jgi:hypothetical protein